MAIDLLKNLAYINGSWCAAHENATFPVTDPANDAVIGTVPDLSPADTDRAIAAAQAAFADWSRRTGLERADLLWRWHALVVEHARQLAELMTRECGKPLAESIGEVRYGASFIRWCAEEARRGYGEVVPSEQQDRRLLVLRQPVGVVSAITPWNFPMSMITRKVSPALAAGCTVVLKPSEETPLSALALAALAHEAGLPPGVLNVVTTTQAREVGQLLSTDPRVRKVTFTGSTAVGKQIMALAAGTVKRVSLELGGNAPFIVFDDADLEAAVDGAIASKFRNAGQTCVCANRILVQRGIAERFIPALSERARALRVGHGLEEGVQLGPLINDRAVAKVERLVADAVAQGARLLNGGSARAGRFFPATVLAGVTPDMACFREEIFGPVVPVTLFDTEEEAIALANDTPYGLAAYFYTRDLARSWRVAEALAFGMVGLNTGLISTAAAPFGGMKESGIGREGSGHALEEFTEMKYLAMAGLGAR
jgi:succinate-semialdehyde dehydrogenase/glutarate-semialdehyde dehydrogenase